jgi:hypothetical protein
MYVPSTEYYMPYSSVGCTATPIYCCNTKITATGMKMILLTVSIKCIPYVHRVRKKRIMVMSVRLFI